MCIRDRNRVDQLPRTSPRQAVPASELVANDSIVSILPALDDNGVGNKASEDSTSPTVNDRDTIVSPMGVGSVRNSDENRVDQLPPTSPRQGVTLAAANAQSDIDSSGFETAIVSAYQASMFSHQSDPNATVTPVSNGASVRILKQVGEWLYIEVQETEERGYIHITHLADRI